MESSRTSDGRGLAKLLGNDIARACPMVSLPRPFPAYKEGSFASFTVTQRLPKIMQEVVQQFDDGARSDPRWSDLLSAISVGDEIDTHMLLDTTPFWRSLVSRLRGKRWADLSFFELEFLFYHALNSIASDLIPGFDVFAASRLTALTTALPSVAHAMDFNPSISLNSALLLALSGNEADLSQLARAEQGQPRLQLIVDERPEIIDRLRVSRGDGTIHLLADNAGAELCFDLVLVDVLLSMRNGPVVVHLKPWPMFVSDALVSDVESTLDAFLHHRSRRLVDLGQRLRLALESGRLLLRDPDDWGEPRHMNMLDPELSGTLNASDLVLAKGDLNYRRFFEDRAWPPDSAIAEASVAANIVAFSLRILKSDLVVGLPRRIVFELLDEDPDWRTNGTQALIQRIDRCG